MLHFEIMSCFVHTEQNTLFLWTNTKIYVQTQITYCVFQKKWGKCYDYYDNITVICTNSNVGVATFDAIKHMEHTTVDSFHVCGRWN